MKSTRLLLAWLLLIFGMWVVPDFMASPIGVLVAVLVMGLATLNDLADHKA